MRSGYKLLTEPLVRWIKAEMERQDIGTQEIAQRAKLNPAIVYKALGGKTAPEPETLERLARALGKALPELTIVAPNGPQETTRRRRATSIKEGGSAYRPSVDVAAGLAAWLQLGAEMQHQLAVKVIKEALEAQDFAGSPVLRALHGIAEKMAEMGYTQMSRHIWAEMGKYFGKELTSDNREENKG